LFEEQCLSTVGRFHFAIRPFCDEQIGINRDRDTFQFTRFLKSVEETAE
jgi:hypothetical protein